MKKRFWALFLAVMMIVSVLPTSAFAEDTAPDEVVYGHYDGTAWVYDPDSDGTRSEQGVTLSKVAVPVPGQDNTYSITLEVQTSTTTEESAADAAVVLVMDVSTSMDSCATCGGRFEHERSCTHYNQHANAIAEEHNRMTAAEAAAADFLDTYKDADSNSVRYLAIVAFSDSAAVQQEWVDVSTPGGYSAALDALSFNQSSGTNLEDGLHTANELLDESIVAGITNRFVIALTDGAPTRAGRGPNKISSNWGSASINNATQDTATELKADAKLYTVCFGASDDDSYSGGPTVGNFLQNSVASKESGKTYAYNASNAEELYDAFENITEDVVRGLSLSGSSVKDPMAEVVGEFNVTSDTDGVSDSSTQIDWKLAEVEGVEVEDGVTVYTYTLTYEITLNSEEELGKSYVIDGEYYYPTNKVTTLTIPGADGKDIVLQFPIPAVRAPMCTVIYDEGDHGTIENAENGKVKHYVQMHSYTPAAPEVIPDVGYEFDCWNPTLEDTVTKDITYEAVYKPIEYTVTYDLAGGSSDEQLVYDKLHYNDETPTIDNPTKAGWTFDGWDKEIAPTVTENVTYTAKWKANIYNITYVLDGGTNAAINPDKYTYGVGVESFADATKSGFLFKGWYSDAKFTASVSEIGKTETGDKTLHAKWEAENKDLGIDKVVTSITAPVVEGDVLPTAEEAKTTAKVGDTITWTIAIENKGNVAQIVTLEDILPNAAGTVTVKDAFGTVITKTDEIALAVKETKTFTATYVVQIADAGKELINKAVVTGEKGPSEDPAPGVTVEPAVIIDKRVDKATAKVGDTLTYTISVTNNSSIALENVIVSDATLGKTETIAILAVGETKTFTYTYKVQASDAGKILKNTAVAKIGNDTVGDDSAETKVDPYIPTITPVGPSKPALNYEDHINYIIGYEDGFVRPLNTITRAEVATIFFRLLDDESRENFWSKENPFPDVTIDMWCNNAISTMFNAGIITGYPDGTFGPYDPVSRAEFATIAARFSEVKDTDGETNFLDLSKSYWAYSYIELAEELGWVQGYQGYFRPEDDMTRAEVMTTVNRVLKRAVEEDGMLKGMIEWPDNLPSDWFYEDVQEATNSHTYYRTNKRVKDVGTYQPNYYYEKWSELIENPDWAALERAWSDANDK